MSAQEREAVTLTVTVPLVRNMAGEPNAWLSLQSEVRDAILRVYADGGDSDAGLLASNVTTWLDPADLIQPDGDAIERAAEVLAAHEYVIRDDMLECDCGWSMDANIGPEEGLPTRRPDRFETHVRVRHRAHIAQVLANLLASPVREPGRSEAEIKAAAWMEGVVAAHRSSLTLHAIKQVNPYRAVQVSDTEGGKP